MQARYVLLPVLFALMAAVASVGPAPAGTIEGKVTYTGTPPKMKPIDMSKEPTCAKEHNPPLPSENVVTGPGNALQYVVVYISAGGQSAQPPSQPVRYDQKGGMYVAHLLAVPPNQPLQIYSDDPLNH